MKDQKDRPLTMELRTEINYLAKLAIESGIAEVVRRKCLRLIDEIEDEQEEKSCGFFDCSDLIARVENKQARAE